MTRLNLQANSIFQWTAGLIVLAAIVLHNIVIHPWMLDDAFITFRYAENYASGLGLVYNPAEHVEGYTTFLWVILLGLCKIIGLNIVIFSKVLAAIFATGTIVLVMTGYRFISEVNRLESALAAIFLATCGIFAPWVSSGMEVTLFTYLILLTLFLYIKAIKSINSHKYFVMTGGLLALTVLTRPEGAILVIIIFADSLYRSIKKHNLNILSITLPAALTYVPYFIWRINYYGYLLPNTFYAKVDNSAAQVARGFEYMGNFVLPSIFLLILAVIGIICINRRQRGNTIYLMISAILLFTIYIVIVGGDCMPAFRFVVPVMPLICILAAAGAICITRRIWILAIIIIAVCSFNIYQAMNNKNIGQHINADQVYLNGKYVGLWLKDNFPANTIIATNTAGSIPYYSGFYTIDMLGMNDEHIAHRKISGMGTGLAGHEKGDGGYVLGLKPDLIQFGSSQGRKMPGFPTDAELYNNPKFHELYELKPFYVPMLKNYVLFYVRKPESPKS
jgi:arabinofuranosyltransferase